MLAFSDSGWLEVSAKKVDLAGSQLAECLLLPFVAEDLLHMVEIAACIGVRFFTVLKKHFAVDADFWLSMGVTAVFDQLNRNRKPLLGDNMLECAKCLFIAVASG